MTTIICVGDLHVSDRPPANATETYTDDIISMLKWVADHAVEIKADAVVWSGDVFHHKAPGRTSHQLVLRMIEVVKYYLDRGIDLWCVTGNHDVTNDQVDIVRERQPLGVLYAAGLRELDGWHPLLPLFGVPWRSTWTEPGDPMKALAGWRGEDFERLCPHARGVTPGKSLVVTHAPIYPPKEAEKQLFELVPLAGEGGLSEAMGNQGYLYYGHIHEDHGIFTVEGVTYANMGAISRGSLHEYNLERKIQVAVWTEDGFTAVEVPHKPASEVFRLAEALEERTERLSLEGFLADVGSRTLEISSAGTVIAHIQGRSDVSPSVKKRAIEILEEVS